MGMRTPLDLTPNNVALCTVPYSFLAGDDFIVLWAALYLPKGCFAPASWMPDAKPCRWLVSSCDALQDGHHNV